MKTITVLTEDQPGVITRICDALAAENINIESLDADTHLQKGIIILTVDKYDRALEVLKDKDFQAVSDDSLLIQLTDRPGALAKIARRFSDAGINLKGMRIMSRDGDNSIVALSAEDQKAAIKLVNDVLIK